MASAFDYAGQKCSAASRVLVHEAIAEPLLERLAGACRCSRSARRRAREPTSARDRAGGRGAGALATTRSAAREGTVVAERRRLPGSRLVLPADGRRRSAPRLAGAREEMFGPLLASSACATSSRPVSRRQLPFALTGGLFARNPATVRYVAARPRSATSTSTAGSRARWWAPALRRQPAVGDRYQGRRPGLSAAVRRAARRDREHDASRA